MDGIAGPNNLKQAMKTRNPYCLLLLFSSLLCSTGCGPSAPKDREAAKAKVLREIGVSSEPAQPAENPMALKAPEQREDQSKDANAVAGTQSLRTANPQPKKKVSTDDPSANWITADKLPRELWEVQYLGNAQVGFSYKKTAVAEALGSNYFRHELDSRIRVSVKSTPLEQRIQIMSIELANGELKEIEGSLEIGTSKRTFKGIVNREKLKLTTEENGRRTEKELEWKKIYRGPFAVEQSMLRKPMEEGELRLLKYFDPLQGQLIDGELDAKKYIPTPTMLDGSQDLLEVRSIGRIGEGSSQSLLWVDNNGEGLKSFVQGNDILSFRSRPIVGQIFKTCSDLRAVPSLSIPIIGDIEKITGNFSDAESMTYRIRHKTEETYPMFTDKIGQNVKTVENKIANITVFRNAKELDPILGTNSTKNLAYLANSDFVPKDLPAIQKLGKGLIAADKALSNDSSTSDNAKACQRAIRKGVKLKDYDIQIRPIQLVLKSRNGNCVEHATLLAAVCRSLGIPSRIAIGVKFNGSKETPAMQFHTWVEILDGLRWVPMDSSQEDFSGALDRVKFRDSDFNAANPYLELLEVYKLLPGLDIEVRPL